MATTKTRFGLAVLLLSLGACTALPEEADNGPIGGSEQALVITGGTTLWTNNGKTVPMCWHELLQFPDSATQNAAKKFVTETIQDGWINRLNLNITWVDCPTSGDARHVRVKLRSGDAGYNGTTLAPGMETLTTAAQRLVPEPNDPPGLLMGFPASWNANDGERAVFRSLILHEFGHVLGFHHEQLRSDGPSDVPCYDPNTGVTTVGVADPKSIMGWSYCSESLGVPTLNDVRAARSLYGRRDLAIRGVLLLGKFRTQTELNAMSGEDQRNTLIVELAGRTNQPIGHFQGLDDQALAGAGAVLVFLREAQIRSDEQLASISDDDQRNIAIVEIGAQTGLGSTLQGLSSLDVVLLALGKAWPGALPSDLGRESFIRGVLLAGKFRTQRQLNAMSDADQRNTLIVELAGRTNQSGAHFQSLDDASLAGAGATLVFLRGAGIRSDEQLRQMSDDDQRNVAIVELGAQSGLDAQLQGLSSMDLVRMAFGLVP